MLRRPKALIAVTATAMLAACVDGADARDRGGGPAVTVTASDVDCSAPLGTTDPGRLTWGTTRVIFPPWFTGARPEDGGFESAVAAAVSRELGFEGTTAWVRRTPQELRDPAANGFDIGIGTIVDAATRESTARLSERYYREETVLVGREGTRAPTTIAEVRDLKVGGARRRLDEIDLAAVGIDAISYDDDAASERALRAGEVDALVADSPYAFVLSGAVPGLGLWGALPVEDDAALSYSMTTAPGGRLGPCVDRAVRRLRDSGALARLERTWLPGTEPIATGP